MGIESFDTSREELKKRIPELKAQCSLSETDATKLKELKGRVEKCKSDMSSCASLATQMESEVQRLQKAILDAGGERLKKQQKHCNKIVNDLNDLTKKLNSAKVQLTSSKKNVEKATKAKETYSTDLEKSITSLQEKKDNFKKLEAEAIGVMEAYEKVQNVEHEKKSALEAVSRECESLKKSEAKIKHIEVEMKSKLENCEKSLEENQRRKVHWEGQISILRKEEEVIDDESEVDLNGSVIENIEDDDVSKRNMQDENDEKDDEENQDISHEENLDTLPVFLESALRQYDKNEVKQDISILQKEREVIAKNANMQAIREYKKKEKDYLER